LEKAKLQNQKAELELQLEQARNERRALEIRLQELSASGRTPKRNRARRKAKANGKVEAT
jgi:hypothetical protein